MDRSRGEPQARVAKPCFGFRRSQPLGQQAAARCRDKNERHEREREPWPRRNQLGVADAQKGQRGPEQKLDVHAQYYPIVRLEVSTRKPRARLDATSAHSLGCVSSFPAGSIGGLCRGILNSVVGTRHPSSGEDVISQSHTIMFLKKTMSRVDRSPKVRSDERNDWRIHRLQGRRVSAFSPSSSTSGPA